MNEHAGKSTSDQQLQLVAVSADQCVLAGWQGSSPIRTEKLSGGEIAVRILLVSTQTSRVFFFFFHLACRVEQKENLPVCTRHYYGLSILSVLNSQSTNSWDDELWGAYKRCHLSERLKMPLSTWDC